MNKIIKFFVFVISFIIVVTIISYSLIKHHTTNNERLLRSSNDSLLNINSLLKQNNDSLKFKIKLSDIKLYDLRKQKQQVIILRDNIQLYNTGIERVATQIDCTFEKSKYIYEQKYDVDTFSKSQLIQNKNQDTLIGIDKFVGIDYTLKVKLLDNQITISEIQNEEINTLYDEKKNYTEQIINYENMLSNDSLIQKNLNSIIGINKHEITRLQNKQQIYQSIIIGSGCGIGTSLLTNDKLMIITSTISGSIISYGYYKLRDIFK